MRLLLLLLLLLLMVVQLCGVTRGLIRSQARNTVANTTHS